MAKAAAAAAANTFQASNPARLTQLQRDARASILLNIRHVQVMINSWAWKRGCETAAAGAQTAGLAAVNAVRQVSVAAG